MRFIAVLAVVAAFLTAGPAFAAKHRAGVWEMAAQAGGSCLATMPTDAGLLHLLGTKGELAFGAQTGAAMRKGQRGVLSTEAYSFAFKPEYGKDDPGLLYTVESLGAREVAGLRLAERVRIEVDGELVLEAKVANTGLEEVLDSLVACSQGEAGWWGPGAAAADQAASGEAPALNAEGYWSISPGEAEPGICSAVATVDDDYVFMLLANHQGAMTFAVGSETPMSRGRKGHFETDAYAFDFRPTYDGDTLVFGENLDSQAVFAIRRARTAKVSIGGRTLVDMDLEASGHATVIDDLLACARSEAGWWGEGALKP